MPGPRSTSPGRRQVSAGGVVFRRTPEVTVLREIAEETGPAIAQVGILGQLAVDNYLVEVTGESGFKPQLCEIEEGRWFSAGAAVS